MGRGGKGERLGEGERRKGRGGEGMGGTAPPFANSWIRP